MNPTPPIDPYGFSQQLAVIPTPGRRDILNDQLSDAELVRRARGSCAEAWQALYERHVPTAWRYAYALLHDRHVAEDVVAETMFALLRALDENSGNAVNLEQTSIAAWLRAVVRNKSADHFRKKKRTKHAYEQSAIRTSQQQKEERPSGQLETAERQLGVVEILETLSDRQRTALELKYVENLSVKEIAVRLEETEKAVEATLYRARREFRRHYEFQEKQAEQRSARLAVDERSTRNGSSQPETNGVAFPEMITESLSNSTNSNLTPSAKLHDRPAG
ncbi:MAG: RNA polymerase sigma factor [Lacipirellulaceae bacterium]